MALDDGQGIGASFLQDIWIAGGEITSFDFAGTFRRVLALSGSMWAGTTHNELMVKGRGSFTRHQVVGESEPHRQRCEVSGPDG